MRTKRLSSVQRSAIAKKAARTRWAKVKGKKPSKTGRPQSLLPAPRRTHHTA
jgi:hypothetical protein